MFKQISLSLLGAIFVVLLCSPISSALQGVETQYSILMSLSQQYEAELQAMRPQLYYDLLAIDTGTQGELNNDPDIELMYIDNNGFPVYYSVDNINAAKTISTDKVWPGGISGFNLDGSNTNWGEFAVWEVKNPYLLHPEFMGRVIKSDSNRYGNTINYHATHVTGTLIASGLNPLAKGMSPNAVLSIYDTYDGVIEMPIAAANGLKVSNHSYGRVSGWSYNGIVYFWNGDTSVSIVEDYKFGFYDLDSRKWDEILFNSPYYSIVKTAGNDRDDMSPEPGTYHLIWNNTINQFIECTVPHESDADINGYGSIPTFGTAKNVITVGAVHDIPDGYSNPNDVVMSQFSNWGPTDDGRIKPDIVANGVRVYSSYVPDYYDSISGTSMAAPAIAGSINLLVSLFEETHNGETPLASTMKAVMIQTADEAGAHVGPDYQHGWGLMNTLSAAEFIDSDGQNTYIKETILADGEEDEFYLYSNGSQPLKFTLVWTDPPGIPPVPSLNPTTLMLVNDLDIRVNTPSSNSPVQPYTLDPENPTISARAGDNFRDNVEQIYISTLVEGFYHIKISHKGSLEYPQMYSLVSSHILNEVNSTIIFVDAVNGSDASGDGSESNPYASITKGVAEAAYGSTVLVHPGTYNENAINFNGKRLTVKATAEPGADSTIITPTTCAFIFNSGENSGSIVDGFQIKFGLTGIQCFNSSPTISHNVFAGQTGTGIYGAICLWGDQVDYDGHSPAVIVNNTISGCNGSGIQDLSKKAPTIKNNIIQYCADYGVNLGVHEVLKPTYYPNLSYNDLWLNGTNYSSNIIDTGIGSITASPVTISYHLSPMSLCIDAGDPDPLYNDPDSSRNDMGAIPSMYPPQKRGGYIVLERENQSGNLIPSKYVLRQNYPNPFNPKTEIRYEIPVAGRVRLEVYNIMGQQVITLVDGYKEVGYHNIIWDGKSGNGKSVASGVYLYKLIVGDFVDTKKMLLMK